MAGGSAARAASGSALVVSHPTVLDAPLSVDEPFALLAALRGAPAVVEILPASRHRGVFEELCRRTSARGNAVLDAYLAALAIEHGCTWYSADRGFARYPGLRFQHPVDAA